MSRNSQPDDPSPTAQRPPGLNKFNASERMRADEEAWRFSPKGDSSMMNAEKDGYLKPALHGENRQLGLNIKGPNGSKWAMFATNGTLEPVAN